MKQSAPVSEGRVGSVRYRMMGSGEVEFCFFPRNMFFLRTLPFFPTILLFMFIWLMSGGITRGDQSAFGVGLVFFLLFAPLVIFMFRLACFPRQIVVTRRTIVSSRPGLIRMRRSESSHGGTIGALIIQDGSSMALILVAPSGEHIAWLITTKRREQIDELLGLLRTVVRVEEGSVPAEVMR